MALDDAAARKARTAALFDRLAPEYDAAGVGCFAHFGERLVDAAGVGPGMRVLDVASGRGAVLFPAAERVGPDGTAEGIDLAEGMARAANADARRRGIAARVRVLDAELLDYPNASFDRVLCGFGLMFFPNLDRALDEFRRVLRPAGLLGVSTWQVSQAHDLAVALDGLGLGGPGERGWITDPVELARLLERAGFADARVTAETHVFRYDDIEHYWRNARGTGVRRRLDALDAAQTARVRAAFAEQVAGRMRVDGLHLEATALLAVAAR